MIAEFEVKLTDKITPTAKTAAAQIGLLRQNMSALEKAGTKAAALGDVGKMQALSRQYSALGASVHYLSQAYPHAEASALAEARAEKELAAATEAARKSAVELAKAKKEQAEAENAATAQTERSASVLGGPLVAGALAATAAVVALAAGIGALIVKGAQLAITASQDAENMRALFTAMGRGKVSCEAVIATLDGMEGKLAMTRAQMAPFARELMAIGFTDLGQLRTQLTAIASIKAFGGDEAAEKYITTMTKLREGTKVGAREMVALQKAGVDVDAIMRTMGAKTFTELEKKINTSAGASKKFQDALTKAATDTGADALRANAMQLGTQWERLQSLGAKLFEGVKTSALGEEFKKLVDMFDTSTTRGKQMKATIELVFNGVMDSAAKAIPYVRHALNQLIIAFLEVYIGAKPLRKSLGELWDALGGSDGASHNFANSLHSIVKVTGLVANGIRHIVDAVTWLQTHLQAGGSSIGTVFTDTLLNTITGGIPAIIKGVMGLGGAMVSALKRVLGIASPSTVMIEVGTNVARGVELGIAAERPRVEGSAAKMGAAIPASFSSAASPSARATPANDNAPRERGSNAAPVVHFHEGAIKIDGAGKDAEEITTEMIATVFERLALTQGLGLTG